ncbi:MAG: hypothetical protein H0T46_31460 [Deltaproteobacteria bacterium]|nr:hypothetical protein [Deltaproteobacteria bacterium]
MNRIAGLALLAGCAASQAAPSPDDPPQIDKQIAGLAPAKLGSTPALDKAITTYYGTQRGQRTYIQTDKPLYQPGETIWFRADLRTAKTMVGDAPAGVTLQLISPRGSIVANKRVLAQGGIARNDFVLDPNIEGGEYTIQLTTPMGQVDTRKVIVNTYEAPRLMKTLELLRTAYGANDSVSAALEIKRTNGEAFANKKVTAVVTIDDAEVSRTQVSTDGDGKAIVKFQLPAQMARGDGLLTVLVEDGGITESIQKRIPIVMTTLNLALYPEGGDLVQGVPGRVYFMAKTTIGKPADIEGKVVDDRGQIVSTFTSVHDGMGSFELQPTASRKYRVEITKPVNITTKVDVPAAKNDGCVIRSLEQKKGTDQLRVAAICASSQTVAIEATLRENRLGGGAFNVEAGKPALVVLPIPKSSQGAVRVTLFSDKNQPLAERLVYHGTGANLKVTLTADKKSYSPREKIKLKVRTQDAKGNPVKANVALAVVDDTVLSYADDKSAKILAKLYLEPELGATAADPIEEPNFYFTDKPEAAAAMDALLATRGYRKFEWRQVSLPAGGTR